METESKKCKCGMKGCRGTDKAFSRLREVVSRVVEEGVAVIRAQENKLVVLFDEGLYWQARAALECAKESSGAKEMSRKQKKLYGENPDPPPSELRPKAPPSPPKPLFPVEYGYVNWRRAHTVIVDSGTRAQEAEVARKAVLKARLRAVAVRTQGEITIQVCRDQTESRKVAISEARDEIEAAEAAAEKAEAVWREAEIGDGVSVDEKKKAEQRVRDADRVLSKAYEVAHTMDEVVEMARQTIKKAEVAYRAAKDVERVYQIGAHPFSAQVRAARAVRAAKVARTEVLVALGVAIGEVRE